MPTRRAHLPKSDTNPLTKAKHLYYIAHQARQSTSSLINGKDLRSPMSRISLTSNRHTRAVWDRPATDTRLLPSPPHLNTHYKRCPKALRLRLRSDQSPSRPLHGRSPDKSRHTLSKGHCQVRTPLTRRIRFASSGDASEYGVMSPPWAIAPPPDSPGLDLAGESEQSDERRLKTNAPFKDSTVVTTGELPTTNGGHGSPLPSLRMVEHFWWTGLPHTENFSGLVHIPSEVRGKDSTVVTTGELPTTNAGLGSPLPSLGMVEHFWWSRLPHSETSSRLLHILSEVRGCRRVVADVKRPQGRTPRIATGVADILRNRPGPSITSSRGACPPEADLSRPRSAIHPRKGRVSAPRGIPSLPLDHFPSRDDRPVAQGVGASSGASTPLPPTQERDRPLAHTRTPFPHN